MIECGCSRNQSYRGWPTVPEAHAEDLLKIYAKGTFDNNETSDDKYRMIG
jgi:hypothetical protein